MKKLQDLPLRLLMSGIGIILIAVLIFIAQLPLLRPIFTACIGVVAMVAVWEYYQLVRKKGYTPSKWIGLTTVLVYIFTEYLKSQKIAYIFDILPNIVLLLSFFACFFFYGSKRNKGNQRGKESLINIATTYFGIIYLGVPLGMCVAIVYFFAAQGGFMFTGSLWLLYLIIVTKSADIGGYFIGRAFGRRKLAHRLSPNKTVEGAIAGVIASMIMSVLLILAFRKFDPLFEGIPYVISLTLGLLVGVVGQLGDLAESLLKRDVGVKDSNAIPAIGGILDMVDSLLFTTPLIYIFLMIKYNPLS